MDSNPKALGYDESDGPTKNKDGYFLLKSKNWMLVCFIFVRLPNDESRHIHQNTIHDPFKANM